MNKTQWYVLAVFTFLMGNFFIFLDFNGGWYPIGGIGNPCTIVERSYYEQYNSGKITQEEYGEKLMQLEDIPLDKGDIHCAVRELMLTPFIWLFYPLGLVFLVLAWLEPKKRDS